MQDWCVHSAYDVQSVTGHGRLCSMFTISDDVRRSRRADVAAAAAHLAWGMGEW